MNEKRLQHIATQLREALDCAHEAGGRRHECLEESDSDLLHELVQELQQMQRIIELA